MSRKKKNRRDKKKRGRPLRPRVPSLPPKVAVHLSPPGMEKMSEVLGRFIEPYLEIVGKDNIKKLVDMAVMAWNAALLPASERRDFMHELIAQTSPEDAGPVRAFMEELIQSKLTHFADNKRIIMSYEVVLNAHNFSLNVASTLG
jgi:hypothetical protein